MEIDRTLPRSCARKASRARNVGGNVSAAEPIDRLLGIADQEQRAGPDLECGPVVVGCFRGRSPQRRQKISVCSGSVSWNSSTRTWAKRAASARRTVVMIAQQDRARRRSDRRSRAGPPSACSRGSARITGCTRSTRSARTRLATACRNSVPSFATGRVVAFGCGVQPVAIGLG